MSSVTLYGYQEEALGNMKNGCILNGDVGSGKSRTALAYYYTQFGGRVNTNNYVMMKNPCDLYIITPAQKRDKLEWEDELRPFLMSPDPKYNKYRNKIVIDSWNNIQKYTEVHNAFFIFDEQRVVGYGAWTKSFLEISKSNQWILLSATPGDTFMDYMPVFIANGFYKNKTDFVNKHVIYSRFTKYPKVDRYINTGRLIKLRDSITVGMKFERKTISHHEYVISTYDKVKYDIIKSDRWNIYKEKPIENAGEYCLCLRRLVNSSVDRQLKLVEIIEKHPKAIIFYNHDYELDILRHVFRDYTCAEWNGHKHEPVPKGDKWVYLVEYAAGNDAWNCITTDTMIFYSQNYSYRVMKQASGRIDRSNTPFVDLYYYHMLSNSTIDKNIYNTLRRKKKFNEKNFAPEFKTEVKESEKRDR